MRSVLFFVTCIALLFARPASAESSWIKSCFSSIWDEIKPKDEHALVQGDQVELAAKPRNVMVTRFIHGKVLSEDYMITSRDLETLTNIRPEFFNLSELAGTKVLDAGTGLGSLVSDLRSRGIDAYGVDIAADMPSGIGAFIRGDIVHLPFRSNSFDFAYSNYSVFYYERDPGLLLVLLKEMKRVLRPGGKIRLVGLKAFVNYKALVDQVDGLKISREFSPTLFNRSIELIRTK